MQNKKLLYEVSIIRPSVIFLLVVLHSFTRMSSGWETQLIGVYKWLCCLIHGFRIETIALMAGYVFAYQSIDLERKYQLRPFVGKKFKRLIIPMLFFGIIYYFCFKFESENFGISDFLVALLSGCGHLWFLPMLFWCFIAIWTIDHYKLSSIYTLIALALLSMAPIPKMPFGFARLPHFVFYVYLGYYLWTKRDYIFSKFLTRKWIFLLWSLYVFLVIILHTVIPDIESTAQMFLKVMRLGFLNLLKLLISCVGIIALYISVCYFCTNKNYVPKQWIVRASDNCYGIYVYHQFILVYLYYHTSLDMEYNQLIVPWVGLVVSLSISYIFTRLTLKTRIGRYLIG